MERVSSAELTEWMAYSTVEPFGEERADLRAAIVASVVANANRPKGQKPYKVEDFMPRFGPEEPQTPEQMIQFAQMMTLALGGEDRRGEAE